MRIRAGQQEDLPALVRLLEEPLAAHWNAEQARLYLEPQAGMMRRICLVADMVGAGQDGVVGMVAGTVLAPDAELQNIVVGRAHCGRGVGRALLGGFLGECLRNGARKVMLEVRASNVAAMGLYARAGFARTGERRWYYSEPVEDAILMAAEI